MITTGQLLEPRSVSIGISVLRRSIRHRPPPRLGWHTFRHTYSTLLRATGADIKVMQELLRHASARLTLDTYTQAITDKKRRTQTKVVRLLVRGETRKKAHLCQLAPRRKLRSILCPSVPRPNQSILCKMLILIGVPDGI